MCSNLMALGDDIRKLESLGVDMLHVDVMDAHFVPNLTFGPDVVKAMQTFSKLPVDVHVMVEDPDLVLGYLALRPGDVYSAHVELDRDYSELAASVHSAGALFGLAVNPETPVESLEKYIGLIDTVTLMLVHPGYAGARMVDGIMEKVALTRAFLDANGGEGVLISVDGSVSPERAAYMASRGASIFVGGTAGIYRKGMRLEDTIPSFREAIEL